MKTDGAGNGRNYRGKAAEDRSQERRTRFVEAGIELFGTVGFAAATVKSLCVEAGLTERYFYESFPHREALFLEVATECVTGLMSALADAERETEGPTTERVPAMLEVFFRWFRDDHRRARIQLFEPLVMGPEFQALYREVVAAFAVQIQGSLFAGLEVELARRALDPDLLSHALVGGAVEIAKEWILDGYRRPIRQMVRTTAFPLQALVASLSAASRPATPPRSASATPTRPKRSRSGSSHRRAPRSPRGRGPRSR